MGRPVVVGDSGDDFLAYGFGELVHFFVGEACGFDGVFDVDCDGAKGA